MEKKDKLNYYRIKYVFKHLAGAYNSLSNPENIAKRKLHKVQTIRQMKRIDKRFDRLEDDLLAVLHESSVNVSYNKIINRLEALEKKIFSKKSESQSKEDLLELKKSMKEMMDKVDEAIVKKTDREKRIEELEKKFQKQITITARQGFHLEQFEIIVG